MDQDSVSFDCAPNVIGKSRKKRKFFYQTFLAQIDKQLMQKIQKYLIQHQKQFQQQKQKRLKIETEKPSIDQYKKRRPIIKFTLYEDLYLIQECKKFQGVISKSSFFWYIALHLDRNVHYVQERIKKKLPNMTIKDLRFAIQHQVPLRFGWNRTFIPPKIKEAKIQKDNQSESYESESEYSESQNSRLKTEIKLMESSSEEAQIRATIDQESEYEKSEEQYKVENKQKLEIPSSQCFVPLKIDDQNEKNTFTEIQSDSEPQSYQNKTDYCQSNQGQSSQFSQIEPLFSEQIEPLQKQQAQADNNRPNEQQKTKQKVYNKNAAKNAFDLFKQRLKHICFFYAQTESSENEQGQKNKSRSIIVIDMATLQLPSDDKQAEPITQ